MQKRRYDHHDEEGSLTWGDVARALGAYERNYNVQNKEVNVSGSGSGIRRRRGKGKGKATSTSRHQLIDEENDIELLEKSESEEEDIGEYNSSEDVEEYPLDDDDEK
ncbi:hypothetical protein L6452_27068 [Arctium lappa]|uniref:Uncharacterized protein n=1 Tax=Arctium lappa TaxID=4217 RepID=A0ACB8ZUR5_ARCLA|nr:hypothetical protein L6452_27068 [Arctium lappa]